MNLLVLVGSTRPGSFNAQLAELAVADLPAGVTVTRFDRLHQLPFYEEHTPTPPSPASRSPSSRRPPRRGAPAVPAPAPSSASPAPSPSRSRTPSASARHTRASSAAGSRTKD